MRILHDDITSEERPDSTTSDELEVTYTALNPVRIPWDRGPDDEEYPLDPKELKTIKDQINSRVELAKRKRRCYPTVRYSPERTVRTRGKGWYEEGDLSFEDEEEEQQPADDELFRGSSDEGQPVLKSGRGK
jgi:hypothetical protein